MLVDEEVKQLRQDVNELQKDVSEIKGTQPLFKEMLQRNINTQENLARALNEIEKSMILIQNNLQTQQNEITAIKADMENNTSHFVEELDKFNSKLLKVDEEGKFNIRTFIKSYFPWIVIIIGIGVSYLSKFIKF